MARAPVAGVEVEYSEDRWRILREKREKARRLLEALQGLGSPRVHGSIARGDVTPESDIDVIIPQPVPPGLVELALERAGYRPVRRLIVQATPSYVPKVYFVLDYREEMVVSVPLAPLRPREREFYKWGGELGLEGIAGGKRVPGVNKELLLIIPTPTGHIEAEIEGIEGLVARILGISIETVLERTRILTRRKEHGRTGVYIEQEIPPGEPVEEAIRRLAEKNKFFRRAVLRP